MTKSPGTAIGLLKTFNDLKLSPHHWQYDQLCKPFADLDTKRVTAAVPAGDEQLALVIRVDQSHQVSQHDAVLMTEPRTR